MTILWKALEEHFLKVQLDSKHEGLVTCHQGRDTEIAQKFKPNDMTMLWKALEEHFLMVQLVFRFNHFSGRMVHFLNFSHSLRS
jgi:hypothetical protein